MRSESIRWLEKRRKQHKFEIAWSTSLIIFEWRVEKGKLRSLSHQLHDRREATQRQKPWFIGVWYTKKKTTPTRKKKLRDWMSLSLLAKCAYHSLSIFTESFSFLAFVGFPFFLFFFYSLVRLSPLSELFRIHVQFISIVMNSRACFFLHTVWRWTTQNQNKNELQLQLYTHL